MAFSTSILCLSVSLLGAAYVEAKDPKEFSPASKDLNQFAREWRDRLGLDSWKVTVYSVRREQLAWDAIGHGRWDWETKTIEVFVLDRLDYEPLKIGDWDLDQRITVVHELVHLRIAPLRAQAPNPAEEGVVVALTRALYNPSRPRPEKGQSAAETPGDDPSLSASRLSRR